MKKKYEELRNQSAQETIDQEKQRITRNIGRLKGQIKELIVDIYLIPGRKQGFGGSFGKCEPEEAR